MAKAHEIYIQNYLNEHRSESFAISGLQQTVLRSKTDAMRSERTDLNYI
jgi:hypothetical protein